MRILFSLRDNPILPIASGSYEGHAVDVMERASDWGKRGFGKYGHYAKEAVKIMRRARSYDALVLCNVGVEAFVVGMVGKLGKAICPRTTLVCVDLLMPHPSRAVQITQSWLGGIHTLVCIRSGDIPVLARRFNVPKSKCHFAFFPMNTAMEHRPVSEGDYICSAGWAHRDWLTLISALSKLSWKAVVSAGIPIEAPATAQKRIQIIPMQTPDAGRQLTAEAQLVVLPFVDTELPSGPPVLLDAMTAGKAVVATNVNGTRDYIRGGDTGLLVPPANAEATASAVEKAMTNAELPHRLGQAPREDVCKRFAMTKFLVQVINVVKACRETSTRQYARRKNECRIRDDA